MAEFRALMAQMAAELDHNRRCLLDDATLTHPLADRARYLLAEPADAPAATPTEIGYLLLELRAQAELQRVQGYGLGAYALTRAAELLELVPELLELAPQLETERMRLAVCGVVAMSDTPESAAKARDSHLDYWSASADEIARQIDELMRLRARMERHAAPVPVAVPLPALDPTATGEHQ